MIGWTLCSVEGCGERRQKRDWCRKHYSRWLRYGDPTAGVTPNGAPMAFIREAVEAQTEECILWPYGKSQDGYARVMFEGKLTAAGRVSLVLSGKPAPSPDAQALHAPLICHNRGCINHRHLRWGSAAENTADQIADGTSAHGAGNPAAKLTPGEVNIIRSDGRRHADIASDFGVSRSQISKIKSGSCWS